MIFALITASAAIGRADRSLTGEFPYAQSFLKFGHLDPELVARHDRTAKTGLIDGHEIDQLPCGIGTEGGDDQNRGGLRHGFDDQHARA